MTFRTIHYQLCGLNYVYLLVPTSKTKRGEEFIDLPMGQIDRAIASKIIEARVPIRGAEVVFLRKALGMTLSAWAKELGLSAAGIMKWEKAPKKRLSRVNEAAVRAFCAEQLAIKLGGKWSELVAQDVTPKKLSLKMRHAA
jgi:DNA-binding transcriptional regulator YiaG